MRLLDRYVIRSFLYAAMMWFLIMMSLRIVVDLFLNMDEFLKTGLPWGQLILYAGTYYAYHSLIYFTELGGLIVVTAAAFTIAMMNRSNELTAMMASGVSLHRVAWPIILAAFLLGGLVAVDQEFVIPRVADKLVRGVDDLPGNNVFAIRLANDADGTVWYAPLFSSATGKMQTPVLLIRAKAGDKSGEAPATIARISVQVEPLAKKETILGGRVKYVGLEPLAVGPEEGKRVITFKEGQMIVLDDVGQERERFAVPPGAHLLAADGAAVTPGATLATWDALHWPILAEFGGTVEFVDVDKAAREVVERHGHPETSRLTIQPHKDNLQPRLVVRTADGQKTEYPLAVGVRIDVKRDSQVAKGQVIARRDREEACRGEAQAATVDGQKGWLIDSAVLIRTQSPEPPASTAPTSGPAVTVPGQRVMPWIVNPTASRIYTRMGPREMILADPAVAKAFVKGVDDQMARSADKRASVEVELAGGVMDEAYGLTISTAVPDADGKGGGRLIPDLPAAPFGPAVTGAESVASLPGIQTGRLTNVRFAFKSETGRMLGMFIAPTALWHPPKADGGYGYWELQDGRLFYPSDLTPKDLGLRQSSRFIEFLSMGELNDIISRKQVSDVRQVLLTRHTRFTEPINNLVMLLLGLPFILSRVRNLKASTGLCLLMVGTFYAFIYVCRYLALPPEWSAWMPILVFGPVAVVTLDSVKT